MLPLTMVVGCLSSMDGGIYHGDPTDKGTIRAYVSECRRGEHDLRALKVPGRDNEKYMFLARVYERETVLQEAGLDNHAEALVAARKCLGALNALKVKKDSELFKATKHIKHLVLKQIQTLHGEV